ncbi:CLUMA_CG010183, isoform A [Clunio marinus]|uniref:CLUMA_CG010183, isoform A n=1 Tax=Clunio marinus TaxID=568069 RepID=A0A1J1I972_9DIPT|nr:CLUMA_CG010183, isoform A [Clunio marinus]
MKHDLNNLPSNFFGANTSRANYVGGKRFRNTFHVIQSTPGGPQNVLNTDVVIVMTIGDVNEKFEGHEAVRFGFCLSFIHEMISGKTFNF